MIENILDYKKHFFDRCIHYRIPMQNKSILCYALADKVMEQPDNIELRDLLIAAVCDDTFLISHFSTAQSEKKMGKKYKKLKKRIKNLTKKINTQHSLQKQWEQILSLEKVLSYEINPEQSYGYDEETEQLCFLFRKCFEIGEKDSPQLHWQIHRLVLLTGEYTELRTIAPIFFYQLMIKYTEQLTNSSEPFPVLMEDLWKPLIYKMKNSSSAYAENYYMFGWLFRKLCNYYQTIEDVNLPLCRYAFECSSNLIQWLLSEDEEHSKKYLTPCHYALNELPVFYWEPDEPAEYDIYEMFSVDADADANYFNEQYEVHAYFDTMLRNYILNKHVEYIMQFMYAIYLDASRLKSLLVEIYNDCIATDTQAKQVSKECILVQIFEIMIDCMDLAVSTKVSAALG